MISRCAAYSYAESILLGSCLFCLFPMSAWSAEFIRGDVNDDGIVSLADGHRLLSILFRGEFGLACGDAADANNDGLVEIDDVLQIVRYKITAGEPPAAPFPAPGVDDAVEPETDGPWPCNVTGTGSPLSDPSARLQLGDAVAVGGTDRHVSVELLVAHETPLAGYAFELDTAGIISGRDLSQNDLDDGVLDLSGTYIGGMLGVHADPLNATLRVVFLASQLGDIALAPSTLTPVLRADLCLEPGTPAGVYPLTFRTGELVDFASGQRIDPTLVSGTITVLRDVEATGCTIPSTKPTATTALDLTFTLDSVRAGPGDEVPVQLRIETDAQVDSRGLTFSVDFDEERLEFVAVETAFPRPDSAEWPWQLYTADSTNATPGSSGIDEGYVAGFFLYADLPSRDPGIAFPKAEEFWALDLVFRVRPAASDGPAAIRFVDGGDLCIMLSPPQSRLSCSPRRNEIISGGSSIPAELVKSFQLVDGSIEVTTALPNFIRGDANRDGGVDVSDPVTTLAYLFTGGQALSCLDAADADDDGELNISDPIRTLTYLFGGDDPLPAPGPTAGNDPTPDSLDCRG